MEKGEIISINSCALDVTVEEFNKKDLEEAGVLIDYDSDNEIEINSNKRNKKRPSYQSSWSRWIFLGILMVRLVIVMFAGHVLIEQQEKSFFSNSATTEIVYLIENEYI